MKTVTYDFSVDSIVCVDAPFGTDPDKLYDLVVEKLLKKIKVNDITFRFENIFCGETGSYSEDWKEL